MKLYTEEQVRRLYRIAYLGGYSKYIMNFEEDVEQIIPIELPSNEEIKSYSDRYSTIHEDVSDKLGKYLVSAIYIDGAKWMKEQILNQNK
jgi:hypothetical protein